ncbi:hypothetical protein A4X06_0g9297 [Tilletia controversa]|uniref:Uncharacterized protein n=1 Tax=Tilletia controversa TaxID=13291 RepID=A0A8X7MIW5_9BASI|nr:hypothetical protein CF335_g8977 [Tilletia laevis]KAE8237225.1 hypothetical protein A4X06_0g9297 [Tilletia controversa]
MPSPRQNNASQEQPIGQAQPEQPSGLSQPEPSTQGQEASSSLTPLDETDSAKDATEATTDEDARDALLHLVLDQLKSVKARLDSVEKGDNSPSPSAIPASSTTTAPSTNTKGKGRVTTETPPITRPNAIPPHLAIVEGSDPATAFAAMPQAEKHSFRFSLRRFAMNPTVFIDLMQERLSASASTSVIPSMSNIPDVSPPTTVPIPRSSTPVPERIPVARTPAVTLAEAPSMSLSHSTGKVPQCKPELLGTFSGDPNELESFIRTVNSVARYDPDPAWKTAVVRTLALVMKKDAAVWLTGMSDEEAASMTTLTAWFDQMREAFPVNRFEQRRNARSRKWVPEDEGASAYYFYKLSLLRAAYGQGQDEANLVHDILDGLPATLRVMLRLPRHNATLHDVRQELSNWESDWRELNATSLRRTSAPRPSSSASATVSKSAPASASVTRTPSSTGGNPSTPSSSTPYVPITPEIYDPSCVIPAKNGGSRQYRRPDNGKVMTLNRPCSICKGEHFNFEHNHVSAQVRVAEPVEEYPEEESVEEGFETSATTEN